MLRLLDVLPPSVHRAVACPSAGPLADALDEHRVERLDIRGTDLSFRLRPVTTARGMAELARSAHAVRRHARAWKADVVHANGLRAGLIAVTPVLGRRPPVVLQVHDRLSSGPVTQAVRRVLARGCAHVMAVSHVSADAFNAGLGRPAADVVYISIDHDRFRLGASDPAATRRELGVAPDAPLLGQVAQITPWKGQLVAIEALAELRRRHPTAELLLVGRVAFSGKGVRYDNRRYHERLHTRVRELGLDGAVHFLGQRSDVPGLMAALDLLLLPSWGEPFGTVVAEAMAVGTVPLVSDDGGPAEYVEDGVTGRTLPPHRPDLWGRAAADLLDDRGRLAEIGRRAAETAARFTTLGYVNGCLAAYESALAGSRP